MRMPTIFRRTEAVFIKMPFEFKVSKVEIIIAFRQAVHIMAPTQAASAA
jgi:hypothetical protein